MAMISTWWDVLSLSNKDLPLSLILAAICLVAILFLFSSDFNTIPTYEVLIPEQCRPEWSKKAEVLEAPSLQV